MKSIVSYRGQRKCINLSEPYVSGYDIKIKTYYSSISQGTEANTVNKSSFLNHLLNHHSYKFAFKKFRELGFLKFFFKLKKFRNTNSQLGYSIVGEVLEKGCLTTRDDIQIGDKVVASGEYANHSEVVVVPQGMITVIGSEHESKDMGIYSLATIVAVSIHGVRTLFSDIDQESYSKRRCLIVGGGIIGTFCGLYLKSLGINQIRVLDISTGSLAESFFEKYSDNYSFDTIFVCSNSMDGLEKIITRSMYGCKISIIGETQITIDRGILEDKYSTLKFCKSYGSGRGEPTYELLGMRPYFTPEFSISNNIKLSLSLLDENAEHIYKHIKLISLRNIECDGKINIIDWNSK
tara:strand:+ start:14118 stop:15167 length:1050 start_codon:yes stop_codon:yes gene_type:complete